MSPSLAAPLRRRYWIPWCAALALSIVPLSLTPDDFKTSAVASEPSAPRITAGARPILDALYGSMGGRGTFDSLPTLRFTFTYVSRDTIRTSRTHWWDRRDGRYRIQGTNRAGQPFVVLFNVQTQLGEAWLDGKLLAGEERAALLTRAYGLFINDTYWFLMPFKLDDDGVNVARDGEVVVNGLPCDRLKVTFDSVGLTPNDTYWAYLDRATHRMVRWGFILQDEAGPAARESLWDWVAWQPVGPLVLSSDRVKVNDPERSIIRLINLEAGAAWPDSFFTNPAPLPF
ncbi:MAG: hypothetical protein SGI90_08620 [Candidatus Eisenbacteria bacterium]|nr:hypothetical protein [Candidatus Eisenbacteria bacterium]